MQAGSYFGKVLPGEIKVVFTDAENEREMFLITNSGDCVLRFGRGFSTFDMGRGVRIEPGKIIPVIANHLGGAGCNYLNVENMGKLESSYRLVRSG
jgi:hypothetical protein